MTPRQLLRQVELPLALPSIVAGIRVAAVIGVGTATIAAAVGAGGLGEYIFRGLSMVDPTVILAGAIPAAVLALTLDGGLLAGRTRRAGPQSQRWRAGAAVLISSRRGRRCRGGRDVRLRRVARKSGHDPRRLQELHRADPPRRARWRRRSRRAAMPVERRLNLGGTFICDRAIRSGDIDVYVEYTGTALTAIFHEAPDTDPRACSKRSGGAMPTPA